MRGPGSTWWSMARLRPNAGPPMSRTVVKPRNNVAVASAPASRLRWPTSPVRSAAGVGRTSIVCQCMSISPGMSVRPPPATVRVLAMESVGIGSREILSIVFPRTRTFMVPLNASLLPLKTRTSWNSVATFSGDVAPCARIAVQNAVPKKGIVATNVLRERDFMEMTLGNCKNLEGRSGPSNCRIVRGRS